MVVIEDLLDAYTRLDDRARAWLARQGVAREVMLMWPGPIGVADIEIRALDIFSSGGSTMAFVHPVYSGGFGSEIIDIVAWTPSAPSRWFGDKPLEHLDTILPDIVSSLCPDRLQTATRRRCQMGTAAP